MAKKSVDILIKARDQASAKMKKIGQSGTSMASMLKKAGAVAMVALSARAIKNQLAQSLELYGAQEKAAKSLSDALSLIGKNSEGTMAKMKKFASEIQAVTTHGDEAVLEMMSLGASMGNLSGKQLQDATKAAIGLGAAFKMDAVTAMQLVSKAAMGNTSSLSRYGIVLDASLSSQEKFNEILKIGGEKFKLAEGQTGTYAGKIAQMKNAIGDAKEVIGQGLAPVIMAASGHIKVMAERFTTAAKFGVAAASQWRKGFELAGVNIKLALISTFQDAKHLFTKQMPAALSYLKDNWKEDFETIWSGTKAIFSNMWINIRDFFKSVWSWLNGGEYTFQWTSLLEGFQSTLKELPKIAARELTNTEKVLQKQAGKIRAEIMASIDVKTKPDMGGIDTGGGVQAAMAGAMGGARQKFQAQESRFLTLGGQNIDDRQVNELSKLNRILTTQSQKLDSLISNTAPRNQHKPITLNRPGVM